MGITGSQSAPLDIAELIEHEQRVIAGAAEMPIVGTAFLLTHDDPRWSPLVHLVDPLTGQIGENSKVLEST
jgi:hypothetical protein